MAMRGNRDNRGKTSSSLTAKVIGESLERNLYSSAQYKLHNLYVFDWESDFLVKTKSGYWHEYETKISLSDFKADFKKTNKHKQLSERGDLIPNTFCYVCPTNLIDVNDVPEYAGLYYMNEYGNISCVKSPPELHKNKLSSIDLKLEEKFYYNFINSKKISDNHRKTYDDLRFKINLLESELKAIGGYNLKDILK